jgi:hypothetical protein
MESDSIHGAVEFAKKKEPKYIYHHNGTQSWQWQEKQIRTW